MVPAFTASPIDGVGVQLCPSGIATATPWAFTVASCRKVSIPVRSSRPTPSVRRCAPQPSQIRQVRAGGPIEGLYRLS